LGRRRPDLGHQPAGRSHPHGGETPIVYDAAFSGSSHGKIRVYQQKGLTLPAGWALDREGRPTTDPAVAIDGLLAPIGGFKGTGLALLMGILSSMLSGAAYGTELGDIVNGPTPGQDGHFMLALRVSAFEDLERFKTRTDAAVTQLHASRLAPGFDRVYAPGEVEAINRETYRRDGIPLNAVTLSGVAEAAEQFGLDAAFLRKDVAGI
jgi:LDH2 family malate/lactate/ureidoglycolate dehydrogenase